MAQGQKFSSNVTNSDIEAGMLVEATDGELGEGDFSKPKVVDVVRDEQGNIEDIVVEKGLLFKKEIEIPADRIVQVDHNAVDGANGEIKVDVDEDELEALSSVGQQLLSAEEEHKEKQDGQDLLSDVERAIPTAEGLSRMERANAQHRKISQSRASTGPRSWIRNLGPGLLGGLSGNDPSAVTAYSIDGAQSGFGHLWLMLLASPLYLAVLLSCGKIGRVTQTGFAVLLRKQYGCWIAAFAACVLTIANIALITADLAAVGTGLQLLTNVNWIWFVVPVAAVLWYLTVFSNFDAIKKIFIVISMIFVAYIATAILAKPNWGTVFFNTFVPHISFDFASVGSAVALLGATMSPYTMFWQVQGEKEEKRSGTVKQQLRSVAIDIGSGAISGNFIAYFIILSTATTLFSQHKSLTTAADAAQALVPVLGPFAKYLFALGFIGAGLIAIPIMLASTSYAIAETVGWPTGLSKKPWQSEGFYLIMTAAVVVSLALALLRLDPIKLIFWANVLAGVLAPILVIYLLLVGNNRKIMGNQRLGILANIGLIATVLVLVVAAGFFFYGLATGQGG